MSINSTVGAAVIPPPEMEEADAGGRRKLAEQWARMPPAWRRADATLVVATQWTLCVGGVLFAAMITLEVISRYVFSFSISFVNAAARLLLVWFFMLGAGIALRHGAHVGFELITAALPPRARRVVELVGLLAVAVFCIEMLYAGVQAMGPAWAQNEPGLDISLGWPVLAIPVGFAFLLYHAIVMMWLRLRAGDSA